MKIFRKLIFWIHLITGILGGIVIFIMCVTGAFLSFERDINAFAESDMRYVAENPNAAKLAPSEILQKIVAAKPDAKPSGMSLENQPNAAWQVSLGRGKQVFVNPYTGEITGEGAKNWHAFFGFMTDLHRWIALSGSGRDVGRGLTGASNLIFLFLAISGIYIWFPKIINRKNIKNALTFRWKVKGKARDFNWHTVLGFWASLVLIIITLTATVISYTWARNLVYTLTGNPVPPQQQQQPPGQNQSNEKPFEIPNNLDALWAKASSHSSNYKSISMRLPFAKDEAGFTLDEGIYYNKFGRSSLTLDSNTSEVKKWETYGEQNSARQILNWFRFTHTGESFGFTGQFIGFIACIIGAVLVWTGISLSIRRFYRWLVKKRKLRHEEIKEVLQEV